jgi:chemotaxis signal transduction protein
VSAQGYARFLDLPAGELALLRQRAKDLAKAPQETGPKDSVELLELMSRAQRFSIPLSAVEGITELGSLASIPRAPPFVRGLVSFRGEVLVAVELALVVGASTGFADLQRVIALTHGGQRLALVTERGLSVREASPSQFKAGGVGQHLAIAGTDETFASLVDVAGLIRHVFDSLGSGR